MNSARTWSTLRSAADCALAANGAAERATMQLAITALRERSVGRFMVPHSLLRCSQPRSDSPSHHPENGVNGCVSWRNVAAYPEMDRLAFTESRETPCHCSMTFNASWKRCLRRQTVKGTR